MTVGLCVLLGSALAWICSGAYLLWLGKKGRL